VFFVTPYPDADTPRKRTYKRLQEALRKDVERLHEFLTGRFNVLLHPERFTMVETIRQAARAVTIFHNIMVKRNRHGYVSLRRAASGLYADVANDGADDGAADVAAAAGAGEAAAGMHDEKDPDPVQEQLVGFPVNNPVNAEGSLLYALQERQQARDRDEHELLRDDWAEHIFPNRELFLLPYTGCTRLGACKGFFSSRCAGFFFLKATRVLRFRKGKMTLEPFRAGCTVRVVVPPRSWRQDVRVVVQVCESVLRVAFLLTTTRATQNQSGQVARSGSKGESEHGHRNNGTLVGVQGLNGDLLALLTEGAVKPRTVGFSIDTAAWLRGDVGCA